MSLDPNSPRRTSATPSDRPQVDRPEHANLERRPAAHSHPCARAGSAAPPCGSGSERHGGGSWR